MKDFIGRARVEGALLFAAVAGLAIGAVGSGVTAWLTGHVGWTALAGALAGALTSPFAGTIGADLAVFLEAGPDIDRYRTQETRRTRVKRWVATIALASFVGAAALLC